MRRRAKVDTNHAEIKGALRTLGWQVIDLSRMGQGLPDLLCWRTATQTIRLVEVKSPDGRLTPHQQMRLDQGWPIVVISTLEEAERL